MLDLHHITGFAAAFIFIERCLHYYLAFKSDKYQPINCVNADVMKQLVARVNVLITLLERRIINGEKT